MNNRRWKATWYEGGYPREYIFSAPESRVLARLDFQLLLVDQGQPIPRKFDLEEGGNVLPNVSDEQVRINRWR